MTTQITYPGPTTPSGSPIAQTSAAAAVIALAAAIAGTALLGGIATGSAIEAPAEPSTGIVVQTEKGLPPGGGLSRPIHGN